jgi:hypothetical protein
VARGNPERIALAFNDCINQQDLEGLAGLMRENHPYIDSENEVCTGKGVMIQAWVRFFNAYPDYENHFTAVESQKSGGDEGLFNLLARRSAGWTGNLGSAGR